jgi:hypothetical protein
MKTLAHIGLYTILTTLSFLITLIPEEKGGMTVRYMCFILLGMLYNEASDYVNKQ